MLLQLMQLRRQSPVLRLLSLRLPHQPLSFTMRHRLSVQRTWVLRCSQRLPHPQVLLLRQDLLSGPPLMPLRLMFCMDCRQKLQMLLAKWLESTA